MCFCFILCSASALKPVNQAKDNDKLFLRCMFGFLLLVKAISSSFVMIQSSEVSEILVVLAEGWACRSNLLGIVNA